MLYPKARKSVVCLAIASAYSWCGNVQAQNVQDVQDQNKESVVVSTQVSGSTKPAAKENQPDKSANKDQVQEVMITATRHSTSLLKTPVAVSAVTQEALTRDGITDVRGLSGKIPNLQLSTSTDGSAGVQIAIRGVSNSDFTEIGEPAVSLHVDGLYSPRPQGALALLFDLDRLEVLRGPQGTLFGRNSTGGSINIIPAKPEFGSSFGMAHLDVGNYNKKQLAVVQNIPVNDKIALRATYAKNTRDGLINQVQDFYAANIPSKGYIPSVNAAGKIIPDVDQRYNTKVSKDKFYTNQDEWAGRLSARWKLTDDVQLKTSYERYQNNDAGSIAVKDCEKAAGTAYACGVGGQWNQAIAINTPGITDMSIGTFRAGLEWNVGTAATVEYNFARADQRRREQQDADSGYQPLASQVQWDLTKPLDERLGLSPIYDNQTFTLASRYLSDVHELQVRGKANTLRYVAGLFWMHEKNTIDYAQNHNYGGVYPGISFYHQPDRQSDSKAIFAQTDWEFLPLWNLTIGARQTKDTRADKNGEDYECAGGTGDLCFFNGRFTPTGTGRFNSSHILPGMGGSYGKSAFSTTLPDGPTAISTHAESWKKMTWRLGLTHQMTPNDMIYSSIATGYKAGGFNDLNNLCGNVIDPITGKPYDCLTGPPGPQYSFLSYRPETMINYELGYKGKLLDKRLSLSATLFFSKYKDMQITGQHTIGQNKQPCPLETPTCNAVINYYSTKNVGKADISGLELEGEYRLGASGHLAYSYAYLHTAIKAYHTFSDDIACDAREHSSEPCAPYYPESGKDASLAGLRPYNVIGNHLPLAPRQVINVSYSHDFEFGDYLLTPRISVRWQDKMYFSLRNLKDKHLSDSQAAYTSIDLSVNLAAPDNKWYVEGYVRNLTNTVSKNWASLGGPGSAFVMAGYNDPRMLGVRFGTEW